MYHCDTKPIAIAIALKVFMMLLSSSSVPEKMAQELNPNSLSSKDKSYFPPELKLHRLDRQSALIPLSPHTYLETISVLSCVARI